MTPFGIIAVGKKVVDHYAVVDVGKSEAAGAGLGGIPDSGDGRLNLLF
ncbi:MAG: hypothetical protein IPM76_23385 [Chloroflexi bacterium]|nr:hypothetical protein [Chloroflexota bacterium]